MTVEAESIPYEPVQLRGERLLVLAPHPDDEVIGCGGLVAQHAAEGRQIRVVVATTGDAAGDAATRESETRAGLAEIGAAVSDPSGENQTGRVQLDFLRFPDRQLAAHGDALVLRLQEIIARFAPDLIVAPSPIEIHPDHLALAEALCLAVQRSPTLFAEAALARVAFYEVSRPILPNALVDISAVAEKKSLAIRCHTSQTAIRDYVAFSEGLNRYRAMTLPPPVTAAEGYWLIGMPELRTTPISSLQSAIAGRPSIEVVSERVPISVVIRTRNRPALLREAVASVQANQYAAEIVVVNDGGERPELNGATVLNLERSIGRAAAANEGVRMVSSPYLCFLDDDDLFYPEHLPSLSRAVQASAGNAICYSDAVSALLVINERGGLETRARLRLFADDFDRQALWLNNYIPLPTLLMPRQSVLEAGGFDPAFDLFEDWDLLIRLSRVNDFKRVPRITCEIRQIEGAGSITAANPEGSDRFHQALVQVWSKHRDLLTDEVFAGVLQRQKRRLDGTFNSLIEEKGRRHHAELDITRLQRDKQTLVNEVQSVTETAKEALARASQLGKLVDLINEARTERDRALEDAHHLRQTLQESETSRAEILRQSSEHSVVVGALYGEIHRLTELLETIYGSRTWKLHSTFQKLKGHR